MALMGELLSASYLPHGHCYLWQPGLVWMHVVSDALIGVSYVAISTTLALLVYRGRREIPFHLMMVAFAAFIIACGATHFMEVYTLWVPRYWLAGAVKVVTAMASVLTAVALPLLVPLALQMVLSAKLSERRQLDLQTANEKLMELDTLKSEFLATMSHEIRTPMNAVMGYTGLLLDGELSSEQREFAQITRASTEALLGVINDILDFSKIESGKLTIEPIPFDLETSASETLNLFGTKANEKELDLVMRYAPGTPRHVVGDPGRIRQIMSNLIGNAVKFTQAGHVMLDIAAEPRSDEPPLFRFSITDTGIGISADSFDRLFRKFMQADTSTTRQFGGTGLGLAISKELVELMGGEIGVRSEPGSGSTFWFTLPLRVDTKESEVPPPAGLENLRVLVVDDTEANRNVLCEQAKRWKMRCTASDSGPAALRVLRDACLENDPFQIALLDFHMPLMNGEAVAREIKADRALAGTVLLLLTSGGARGDATKMSEAGFAAYLSKPVRPSVLMDAIGTAWAARALGKEVPLITRHSLAERKPPAVSPPSAGNAAILARVLLAEDNPVNQVLARRLLERIGCRVDSVSNGREVVQMVQDIPYDIVFMDCQMPIMDGYEATRRIREMEAGLHHLPIVALTAGVMKEERDRCFEAGMDQHISKPMRPEDFRQALERWVPQARPMPQPGRSGTPDPEPAP